LFVEEDNFCFGFLVLLIVITVPYTINHGDFFQNESELIIVSLLVTSLSVTYARKFEMISFGMLSKKDLLLFIAIFLYLLGGFLLGFAYKKSQNLWVSTLVHMFYNAWPLLYYL